MRLSRTRDDVEKLRSRWREEPWRNQIAEVLGSLLEGRKIPTLGLRRHEGRLDLRGISIPEHKFNAVDRRFGVSNSMIDSVDLSHSDLATSSWTNCSFNDVLCRRADLRGSRFTTCRFKATSFEEADLRHGTLGGYAGSEPTEYRTTSFVAANLTDSSFGYPLFEDCDFAQTKLDKVDFQGSRFVRCRFSGKLVQVWFHGFYARIAHPADKEYFARTGKDLRSIWNPMEDVDFSDSFLEDCVFVDGVNLATCRFPKDPSHIVLKDRLGIFRRMEDEIGRTWNEPSKSEALDFLNLLRNRKDKLDQSWDILNRKSFEENPYIPRRKNPNWNGRFFDLMVRCGDQG
jgi:uncharacterized protein YjbI with pentapeptide repeats